MGTEARCGIRTSFRLASKTTVIARPAPAEPLDKLKNDQLLLIGGQEYDHWEQLLRNAQNFRMGVDGAENSISFLNRQHSPGERSVYKWVQTNPGSRMGYALISLC